MRPLIAVLCGTTQGTGKPPQPRDFVNRAYSEAVRRAGGVPVLVPLGGEESDARAAVAVTCGLLVTGGVDISPGVYGEEQRPKCGEIDPLRDDLDRWALGEAIRRRLPVLGICRGIQSLAAFQGGTLQQHIEGHRQTEARDVPTHEVGVQEDTLLARVVGAGALPVNTFHHQAVRDVPPGYCVSARATDGTIEGLEAEDGSFRLGVQWHPEEMADGCTPHRALFEALVAAARRVTGGYGR